MNNPNPAAFRHLEHERVNTIIITYYHCVLKPAVGSSDTMYSKIASALSTHVREYAGIKGFKSTPESVEERLQNYIKISSKHI